MKKTIRIGVGGPVGSGKTALIEKLCKRLSDSYSIGVVTNDIYTKEDQKILTRAKALPPERIIGVETGGCPHTAVREDISMNLDAVEELMERFPDIELIFIESGGDNLAATFSPELVDGLIFVIDVGEGEKIPRKGRLTSGAAHLSGAAHRRQRRAGAAGKRAARHRVAAQSRRTAVRHRLPFPRGSRGQEHVQIADRAVRLPEVLSRMRVRPRRDRKARHPQADHGLCAGAG